MFIQLSLLIGIVAGLRAMMAPAAIAWAAYTGLLDLSGSWLSFMGSIWAVGLLTVLAAFELVTDQLPSTPSRKVPQQFGARLLTSALAGAAIGMPHGGWILGVIAGVLGAVIGTYGGAAARAKLAEIFENDLPAGLIEDAVAIVAALVIVLLLPAAIGAPA